MTSRNFETEQDLPTREANDNFWVSRIFKFTILTLLIAASSVVTILFLWQFGTDIVFRERIWTILIPQLGTIVIASLAILGVKKYSG